MDRIYLAHGGSEVVVGGTVIFLDGAKLEGGILDPIPDSRASSLIALRADLNALLAALRSAGIMKEGPEGAALISDDAYETQESEETPPEQGDAE